MDSALPTIQATLLPIPPGKARLPEVWTFLKSGIDLITTGGGLSASDYTALYTVVYNYCTTPAAWEPLEDGQTRTTRATEAAEGQNTLIGEKLYVKYKKSAKKIQTFFVSSMIIGSNASEIWATPTYIPSIICWRDNCLVPFQQPERRLTTALVNSIQQSRRGKVTDLDPAKDALSSLVSLGIDSHDLQKECLDVYKEYLETPYVEQSEAYYKQISDELSAECDNREEYDRRAGERVKEEEKIIATSDYLHPGTMQELSRRCATALHH
ncbi:ubiquitin ligase (cullin) of SCF [Marasmius sp. AFHP31]|nr:ubiquitin ligase (cullin) of SCF [Marasmius sp. AFHP31]